MTSLSPPRLALRAASLCFALALTSGSLACDDSSDDEMSDDETGNAEGDGDGDIDPNSHASAMQPIWNDNCVEGCHEPDGTAASTLDLSGDAYDNIVSMVSTQAVGENLVEPGSAEESYLVAKLRGTQVEFGGLGGTMPSMGAALPEATIVMIEDWINAGAAP